MEREKLENMAETLQRVKNMGRVSVEVLMGDYRTALRRKKGGGEEAIFRDFWAERWREQLGLGQLKSNKDL